MPDIGDVFAGSMGAIVVLYAVVPLFPLLYVILRWRVGSGNEPGVGFQAALLYFRAVSLLVFVSGTALMLHSLIAPNAFEPGDSYYRASDPMEDMRRVAGGLMLGGGVFFLLNVMMLANLVGQALQAAQRIFHGFVLIVSGLVSLGTITATVIILFQENAEFDDVREILAWTLVWTVTYILHVMLLGRRTWTAD